MKIDESRDSKFPAWRRIDTHLWSKPKLYLGAVLWMPTKLLIIVSVVLACLLITIPLIYSAKDYDDLYKNPTYAWRVNYIVRPALSFAYNL